MAKELFDIERVRKNWVLPHQEAEESPPPAPPEEIRPPEESRAQEAFGALEAFRPLEEARPPEEPRPSAGPAQVRRPASEDPLGDARALLKQLEERCVVRFPAQRDTLGVFFREAHEHLEAQQRGSTEEAEAAPLVAVQATLDRLEELLEVFSLGYG
jgi:hypothetical protein